MIKPHNFFSALKKHLSLRPVTLEPVAEERNAEKVTDQEELQELIVTAYTENPVALKVIQALQTGAQRLKQFPLSECELWDNRVYYRNRLFVPGNDKLRLKILQLCHDTLLAGYSGTAKLLKIIAWTYWWPEDKTCVTISPELPWMSPRQTIQATLSRSSETTVSTRPPMGWYINGFCRRPALKFKWERHTVYNYDSNCGLPLQASSRYPLT